MLEAINSELKVTFKRVPYDVERAAKAIGANSPLAVSGPVPDTAYSKANHRGRLSDQTNEGGIFNPISKIIILLLVGHCYSAITKAIVDLL